MYELRILINCTDAQVLYYNKLLTYIEEDVKEKRKATSSLAPQKLKKIKLFELSNVVKPLMKEQLSEMSVTSFKRILDADSESIILIIIILIIIIILRGCRSWSGQYVVSYHIILLIMIIR